MADPEKSELIAYFQKFVTEGRWEKICEVLERRTRYICVVLEDIYQPHNASAVLRSCEGFGIQDVHVIESRNEFDPNKGVTIGADRWLTLHRFSEPGTNNTERCYRHLKEKGYRIVATSPHVGNVTIDELELDRKTALVMGAEYTGLSEYALEQADQFTTIPMAGFSESFNISVSAALCLYEVTKRLRNSDIDWALTEDEKQDLRLEWLQKSVRASDKIKEKYLRER